MELTSEEVAAIRFSGTRYVYNRREVDAFARRVVATLRNHERELSRLTARMAALEHALDVAHAARTSRSRASSERRRALDQAVRVAGAPRPPGTAAMTWEGFDPAGWAEWREAMEAEYVASTNLAMAHEDARRLRGCALALAGEIETLAGTEAARLLAEARDEAADETVRVVGAARETVSVRTDDAARQADARIEEAEAEAAEILADAAVTVAETTARAEIAAAEIASEAEARAAESAARAEAEFVKATEEAAAMLEAAEAAVEGLNTAAQQETDALNRRLAQLRTAVRQAEEHYRELGSEVAAEAAMVGDLIDLELLGAATVGSDDEAMPYPDLSDAQRALERENSDDTTEQDPSFDEEPREAGFYERRLAGLRERLEGPRRAE